MRLTYRYRLYPKAQQAKDIDQTCSAVRFLYNRLLEDRTQTFRETGKWAKLEAKRYTSLPWMAGVDPSALLSAENQLRDAYSHFFWVLRNKKDQYRPEALTKADQDKSYVLMETDLRHYPRFRRKKSTEMSYQTAPDKVVLEENAVQLPTIGKVRARIHRPLPPDAQLLTCTVLKKRSGRFYLLLFIELPDQEKLSAYEKPLGIVFSPGQLIRRSDGVPVCFQHMDPDLEKRIQKAYQTLCRRTPGSKRYEKQREVLAKLHEKRVEQRRDSLHKAARQIANDGDVICMEAPAVLARAKALRRKGLYKVVHDEAWWKFSKLVEQKAHAKGAHFWRVDQRDALRGVCSICWHAQKPVLSGDLFRCEYCGAKLDRESNTLTVLHQTAENYVQQLRSE